MANYSTLQAAIDAGTSNMTTVFSGSRIDGGWGTLQTNIDWFKFNGAVLASVYIHGNSFLGFNSTTDNFYVNERDASVWEFYTETGTIGVNKFYKMRWVGHAYWASNYDANSADRLEWEIFLFDNNQIYLRFYKVPTNYFQNTNGLRADTTAAFSTTAGVLCEKTFTPNNATQGTQWTEKDGRPSDVGIIHKPSGSVIFTLSNYMSGGNDCLNWTATTPEGTTLKIYTKVNNGAFSEITASGRNIPNLPAGAACTLQIKAEFATSNVYMTPKLKSLLITTTEDKKLIILSLAIPNLSPAIGDVTVAYDGLGGMRGIGGPSEAFTGDFTPQGLTWKGGQNDEEHIETHITASANLTEIVYNNSQESEHVEISSIVATATLTDIHDL